MSLIPRNWVIYDTIGILCGYAIRSGRHSEGSQRPPGRPHLRCWIKNNCANCALKWEIQWFDDELFILTCMTSPAKRADVTCQVKPEGRRPDPLLNIPRTGPAHKQPEYKYGFYSMPSDEENRIKITRILSIDALLSLSLRNVWGFLSGPRVLIQRSNERLEYYAAHGKPLWRHNGFCDVINDIHDKTNERTLSYRCANSAPERCQSNYRK